MRKRLYRVLGVDEAASDAQIKKAYHRCLHRTHPDHEGKREEYDLVRRAYVVLSDPSRRARYDINGEETEEQPDNADANAFNVLGQLVAQLCRARPEQLINGNPLVVMRSGLLGAVGGLKTKIAPLEDAEKRATKMLKRFRRKKEKQGANIFDKLVEVTLADIARELVPLKAQLASHERAMQLLDDYEYQPEEVHQMLLAGSFFEIRPGTSPFAR